MRSALLHVFRLVFMAVFFGALRHSHALRQVAEGGIDALNARFARAMGGKDEHVAVNKDTALFGQNGPFWTRAFVWKAERAACAAVRDTLAAVGAHRMVIGHTPQDQVLTRCGGQLHVIDTGISRAYAGRATAWECRSGGEIYEVTQDGRRRLPSGLEGAGDVDGVTKAAADGAAAK